MKQVAVELPDTARSCCRCGGDFPAFGHQRVCRSCRRPVQSPAQSRVAAGSRPLSPRENHVIMLVKDGKQNKEIAYDLHLSEGTIKVYLNRIFSKLRVHNRTELAVWAFRREYSGAVPGGTPQAIPAK